LPGHSLFVFSFSADWPIVAAWEETMRPLELCLILLLVSAGCADVKDERLQAYNQDGLHLFQQGNYLAASESFRAALDLKPEDPALLYNVGECYDRAGNSPKAEHYYQLCLERAPNHPECQHSLASLRLRGGRKDEVTTQVEGWLARQPKLAAAYAEDGWLWHQLGDLPKAQARLQQAISLDPHDIRALIELGRLYETMQRPERAAALYERVLALDPRQVEVTQRLNQLRSQGVSAPHPD
jgi:tetratricopeptide (TPR) repeat protein